MQSRERRTRAEQLALSLGWFSIGLGMTELLAPRSLARAVGLPDARGGVLQTLGAREIGAGIAILAQPDRPEWLWARVAGDAIDLSYLAAGFRDRTTDRGKLAIAMAAVLGVTALDVICAQELNEAAGDERERVTGVNRRVRFDDVRTIQKPVHEVYRFWRQFENFPRFMPGVESVETISERRTRWRATGPAGMTWEWDAEMHEDRPDEWIAWHSLPGAEMEHSGSVRFAPAPGARGTEVRVQFHYSPPAGTLGRTVAWLVGRDPEQRFRQGMARLKQLVETGEIPLSDGPGLRRPAQPAGDPQRLRDLSGVRS